MASIYAIRNDGVKFKELDLEILDVARHSPESIPLNEVLDFHVHNTAMKPWWKTPETEFISLSNKKAPIPDLRPWIDATLVLSPKAHRLLGDILQSSGELLPVKVADETYYIFNCFVVGEADEDKCKFDYNLEDGTKMIINHLEFKETAAVNLVFKTPLESCLTLFCNQKFKDIVESYELKGIIFDPKLIIQYD